MPRDIWEHDFVRGVVPPKCVGLESSLTDKLSIGSEKIVMHSYGEIDFQRLFYLMKYLL